MKVHLQGEGQPDKAAARAREIAEVGADGLFSFEGRNDVFLPLVAAAGQTDLELMTNIAVAGPRSPLHLAHAANDLQIYSEGRFRLGLGSQTRAHIVKRYGGQWGKPAARMGETVQAVKAIFAAWDGAAPLDFRGEFHTHTLMTMAFDPGPNPFGAPPVLMAALGPLMTRTAAEVADGLLIHPLTSDRFFAEKTLSSYTEGLTRSGRTPDDCQIVAQAMVAMGRTEADLAKAINGVAFQSASTDPPRRIFRCSNRRASPTCSPPSTRCPSRPSSPRCGPWSAMTWCVPSASSARLRNVPSRSASASAITPPTYAAISPATPPPTPTWPTSSPRCTRSRAPDETGAGPRRGQTCGDP